MSVMGQRVDLDRQGRERAGFDTEYINHLEVYSLSKGRPSNVYVFTPNVELDRQSATQEDSIADDSLAPLMMVLVRKTTLC